MDFRTGDGLTLPQVDDDSVDLVVTFTVFQHSPSRAVIAANLAEIARVLRPGGVAAIQWNATPGVWRWRLHRYRMQVASLRGAVDPHGRDASAFLGTRVPLPAMDRMLAECQLRRVGVREPDTLFTWAWVVKQ